MIKQGIYKYLTAAILTIVLSTGVYFSMFMKSIDIIPGSNAGSSIKNQDQLPEDTTEGQDRNENRSTDENQDTGKNTPGQQEQPVLPTFGAPDFELAGLDGETIKLSSYKGKAVLISFWRLGISESEKQLAELQKLQESIGKTGELVILAVNFGQRSEGIDSFIKSNKFEFKVLLDTDQKVSKSYNINTLPTTFLVDTNGVISEVWTTAADSQEILDKIQNMEKE